MQYEALGCHTFAGGFTMGVREVFEVKAQLEIHGLGADTVRAMGLDFIMGNTWEDWPKASPCFLYGNPRCTGFSCVTGGYGEDAHGPWSAPTRDIHDFCHYGIGNDIPVMCWESVQQAFSTGRPLLDYLRDELFVPAGYRIAHLFINAATFGNAQHRKRYFFLAYKADKNFNIVPPSPVTKHATVGDIILNGDLEHRETNLTRFGAEPYDEDSSFDIRGEDLKIMPHLPHNLDINGFARLHEDLLDKLSPHYGEKWLFRDSPMPFSMHSIMRLQANRFMPVITGNGFRFIHPVHDRTLTVGELSLLMGWPAGQIPCGKNPGAEIGKGICPSVGTWLAHQVKLYLDDAWGDEDWESRYCDQRHTWLGNPDVNGAAEKTFELTRLCPPRPRGLAGERS